jgi:hypothetical protein
MSWNFTVDVYLPTRARSYAIERLLVCEQKVRSCKCYTAQTCDDPTNRKKGGSVEPRHSSIERLIDERMIAANVNKRVLQSWTFS